MCCNLSHTQYSDDGEDDVHFSFLFSFFFFSMHRASFSPCKKFDRCMCVYIYLYTHPSLWRERERGVSVSH